MKRLVLFLICSIVIFSLFGCTNNVTALQTGNYYAIGDYGAGTTPYLYLNTNKEEFRIGEGSLFSHSGYGKYKVQNNKIIATAQNNIIFEFYIKNEDTIVLVSDEYFNIPTDTEFVYSEDFK